jgi:UDP-GlcNAc:undecaprenyl-phosphate/decaprenyl-phosphate GlcNAc-1-phosphate transferase
MQAIIAIFLIALAITAVSTPWVRRVAIVLGFVDAPAQRKLHSTPMPLMGGLAIFAGAMAALLLFTPGISPRITGVVLAATVVALVGLLDDRRQLSSWAKLAGQFAGFLILLAAGIQVRLPVPDLVNYALTFLWLAGISNAINFLDNMDGLSAGVSAVVASFMLLLGSLNNQFLVTSLAAAVLGACVGFLRYNFKPAQIFMGDAGALFLGFLLAVLGLQLRFPANVNFVTWMAPVFILGLPIFDTTLVVVSRLRRGLSPNTPGKDHISHRLVDLGFSQREAVLILYLVTGVFGMVGVFITRATLLEGYAIGAVTAVLGLYAIIWLERQRQRGT